MNPKSVEPKARYFGRDPSWLEFNARVVAQAEDDRLPLFDRVNFLVISGQNLDEYFMKRVARMKRRLESGVEFLSHDGKTVREQFAESRERTLALALRQAEALERGLTDGLSEAGIELVGYKTLSAAKRSELDAWFQANVYPILTPLAVDQGQRFPFLSNLSKNIGVLVSHPGERVKRFARLKVPPSLPAYIAVPERKVRLTGSSRRRLRFVAVSEIIEANLKLVFPGMRIAEVLSFRITRSASVEVEDDEDEGSDILENVEAFVERRRFAEPVRIEVSPEPSDKILELLREELDLDEVDIYARPGPLDYTDLRDLIRIEAPELETPRWRPVVPLRLSAQDRDIFSVIRERDLFVHHPYESFQHSVESFIATAARDPHVLAIKQTLYRTTADSPFVQSLIHAAQEGKQVACLVELRARFDEDRNLQLVRLLERHGVHVTYGVVGQKTHSKLALVVRREGEQLQTYVHVGTGNYHPLTAKLYTDCGLFTTDPRITADATHVFNFLTGRSLHHHYDRLIVAPVAMRKRFNELIDTEIQNATRGRPARIVAKFNQLEDRGMIERLYAASAAGVKVTLLVRGFCCLRPGVKGLSENIRVLSVIGRFLEHSRIFHFAAGEADPLDGNWYLGSGDWMRRNIDQRVEVIAPVEDRAARRRLLRIMEVSIRDQRCAWDLQTNGKYRRVEGSAKTDPHSPEFLGTFEALCRDALTGLVPRTASDYLLDIEGDGGGPIGLPDSLETQVRRALKMLVARPWLTQREIEEAAGIPENRSTPVRRELERLGLAYPRRIGRSALLEPSDEAFHRIEGQPECIAGNQAYHFRWLAARLIADMSKSDSQHVEREVEAGLSIADVVVGRKEAKRQVWKFFDESSTVTEELGEILVFPARRRVLVAFDGKTLKRIEKALRDVPAATKKNVVIERLAPLIERTQPVKSSRKSRPKKTSTSSDSSSRR